MKKISVKGVAAGVVTFVGLVGLGVALYNYSSAFLSNPYTRWLYIGCWIVPGYVAAAVARGNGVVNGSMVGVTLGLISFIFVALFSDAAPAGIPSATATEFGTVLGLSSILFCGLGGLLWHVKSHFNSSKL
jgi:hypothetical protein